VDYVQWEAERKLLDRIDKLEQELARIKAGAINRMSGIEEQMTVMHAEMVDHGDLMVHLSKRMVEVEEFLAEKGGEQTDAEEASGPATPAPMAASADTTGAPHVAPMTITDDVEIAEGKSADTTVPTVEDTSAPMVIVQPVPVAEADSVPTQRLPEAHSAPISPTSSAPMSPLLASPPTDLPPPAPIQQEDHNAPDVRIIPATPQQSQESSRPPLVAHPMPLVLSPVPSVTPDADPSPGPAPPIVHLQVVEPSEGRVVSPQPRARSRLPSPGPVRRSPRLNTPVPEELDEAMNVDI
jgi:hypothetical protein